MTKKEMVDYRQYIDPITPEEVGELRELTGKGLPPCKEEIERERIYDLMNQAKEEHSFDKLAAVVDYLLNR